MDDQQYNRVDRSINQLADHVNQLTIAFNETAARPPAPESAANTRWTTLFRAVLVVGAIVLPMLVTLNVWMVSTLFELRANVLTLEYGLRGFTAAGPRYTETDAQHDLLQLEIRMRTRISEFEDEFTREFIRKTELETLTKERRE